MLLAARALVDQAKRNGSTPLLAAAQKGNAKCVELLLAARAGVDRAKSNGATPLLIAAARQVGVMNDRLLDIEGILLLEYEFDRGNPFTPEAGQWARNYHEYAKSVKGQHKKLGSVSNWKFYGMFRKAVDLRLAAGPCRRRELGGQQRPGVRQSSSRSQSRLD